MQVQYEYNEEKDKQILEGYYMKRKRSRKVILACVIGALVLLGTSVGIVLAVHHKKSAEKKAEIDSGDPQVAIVEEQESEEQLGAEVTISEVRDENRTDEITYGIDVSKYQGAIDWKTVSGQGVDFAMIRIGYRTLSDGKIVADSNAKYNMQEAQEYGIKVGGYFFSTAITEAEAVEEANWVADYVAQYQITYPIAFDCEGYQRAESRQQGMTNAQRTDVAIAFMKIIAERGYSPLFYGSKSEMENNANWDMNRISTIYDVWVAQYPANYMADTTCSYEGDYVMWQYTNHGSVPGIEKQVDMNIAYFGYLNAVAPKEDVKPEKVEVDPEALMNFTAVSEIVTAKEKTNLRTIPSQGADAKIVHALLNGEQVKRTGVSASGWSRVEYEGQVCYAVSNYLTTDLGYHPPQEEPDDGIKTKFTEVNEQVTAKEAVNLRQKPSVDDAIAPVVVQIKHGDVVTRTGINTEVGWSRVVYNGQVLYCISQYLTATE